MFKVKSRFPNEFRDQELGSFKLISDARLFIESKLRKDAGINTVIYKLFEFDEMLEEFDPSKMDASSLPASSAEQASGQGQGSAASFRPSPFSMAPTPTGVPKKWVKDDDEKKK